MLLFDSTKQKLLEFNMVEVKNIQPNDLSYKLRMVLEDVEYGFSATLNNDTKKISVDIPPISELTESKLPDVYDIYLEVTCLDKSFMSVPFTDKFKIKQDETIKIQMNLGESHDVSDVIENDQIVIETSLTYDDDISNAPVIQEPQAVTDEVTEAMAVEDLDEEIELEDVVDTSEQIEIPDDTAEENADVEDIVLDAILNNSDDDDIEDGEEAEIESMLLSTEEVDGNYDDEEVEIDALSENAYLLKICDSLGMNRKK